MASITIDGLDEEVFRRNIEAMLRVGEADRAAAKLRALLEPCAGEGRILPARFLEATAADFTLVGWDRLGESLARNDLPRHPISALTIAVSDAEAMGIDQGKAGGPGPLIATSHFTDEAYMFSQCGVTDLLDGYSFYGCEWHGSSTHMDTALSLSGVEDLYQAVAKLEAALIASRQPALDMIRAGSLASCYLAVLLYQAVRDTIRAQGLPRPLCVMAGSEGVYPYFDAPVIGSAECSEQGLVQAFAIPADRVVAKELAKGEPAGTVQRAALAGAVEPEGEVAATTDGGFTYDGLAGPTMRKTEKKPVLELAEAEVRSAAEMLERAGQERMGDDRRLPDELLAHRGPSHPLFSAEPPVDAPFEPMADEPVGGEPVGGEPVGAEPVAVAEPEPAEADPFVSPGSFPELAEPEAGHAPQPGPAHFVATGPTLAPAGLVQDERAHQDVHVADVAAIAVRPQTSHSLRARFADTPPPPPPPPPAWSVALATLSRWLHAVFG